MSTTTQNSVDSTREPAQDKASARGCVSSVEVIISWGAAVLCVEHLTPPRSFDIGESRANGRPCDCFVAEEVIGTKCASLIKVTKGQVWFLLLASACGTIKMDGESISVDEARKRYQANVSDQVSGALEIPLSVNTEVDVEMGGVRVCVAASTATFGRVKRTFFTRRSIVAQSISALFHLGVVGAVASLMAPLGESNDDGPSGDQIYQIQQYLASAEEKELAEKETEQVAVASSDGKEGGTGTRARGEEGSQGNPQRTGNRYGIQGPNDPGPHIARQAALRDANEFGMIGLLNSGSGGDPNAPTAPWGRDDSLGNDPLSARGNMWGDQVGQSFGAGGLGLSGRGQGGAGLGSIGTIGHGAGPGASQTIAGHAPSPKITLPPGYAASPSQAPDVAIDPNGRFATTYRPGHGHLAAFEAAIARGIIPAAEREVVSDVGARYTPAVQLDPSKSLALRTDLERSHLSPNGGAFHLRLAMQSSATAPHARPHLSVHLVLDTSGSMSGESIDKARKAAQALVDRLEPTDDFSLTTFSSDAQVKVTDGLVGPRREAIKQVIAGLNEGGGTNIAEGLRLAYTQASLPTIPEDAIRVVLLISDGRATSGNTGAGYITSLALQAFQGGVQTSTFGLGTDYDGQLMSSIAGDGAGGYYYLRSPDQIAPALSTELDQRLDPVATAVEVRVRLKKGVELIRVYGSRRLNDVEAARVRAQEIATDVQAQKKDKIAADRHEDNDGGMRFFMPAFARDDSHSMLFKLRVGADASTRTVATVELKYKDRIGKKNVTEEIPIVVNYANSDAESARTVDASVAKSIQGFAAGESLTMAASYIGRSDFSGASTVLEERESILREAATALHEPLFLTDAARLARLRSHVSSSSSVSDPLVLAMMLETAGKSHLH